MGPGASKLRPGPRFSGGQQRLHAGLWRLARRLSQSQSSTGVNSTRNRPRYSSITIPAPAMMRFFMGLVAGQGVAPCYSGYEPDFCALAESPASGSPVLRELEVHKLPHSWNRAHIEHAVAEREVPCR